MQFEWDEVKNRSNIHKRGIDFTDAVEIFKHTVLTAADGRENFGEDRWIALGWTKLIVAVVMYVERSGDTIRIISARQATRPEIKRYGHALVH
ncbi:BrnT family toxin [Caballeronia sp. SEWSISQ10-4 2]|uniref:BrnT family toxin n=1 Tax=Caballeronia sp. SEWSISQ10-4 2 TaxID=2937438 RepID=UPI00265498E6|nr:BrnT family toxin [Caballeronia sp. SEWSISQ10-4 2]MDN7178082.1 BrnT family toxin [Caballeronia sp. SEWSISQ10-4 2]